MTTPDVPPSARSYGGTRRSPGLEAGFDLLERDEWGSARAFFEAAVRENPSARAYEALGLANYLLHDEAAVFASRETAFELFRRDGDNNGAARVAVWLALDSASFRGQMAVANGWLSRARTLLDQAQESPEHAWLAMVEAEKSLLWENDGESAQAHAARAVELARRQGETTIEIFSLAMEGLALVTTGRVPEGMSKLDEAATACISGEVPETWVVSFILCQMMDACDRVRDWERARQWFAQVATLAERWKNREFYAQCRPHYAVLLTWRGEWAQAENQLQLSIDDLSLTQKAMAVEGIVRLAELRWRQGRWDEAAALFDQVRQEPLAQLGQAALALDRDENTLALDLVERCLRRLPVNDCLERIPALELYVRACLAGDECERARQVLPELEEIASKVTTAPVRAMTHLAKGLIAAADDLPDQARMNFEDSIDLFERSEAPFEAARARLELASVLFRLARTQDAKAQAESAASSFRDLGAAKEALRAGELIRKADGDAGSRIAGRRGDGLTPREQEVLRLLATGLSNQEIADRLVLSIRTVQRHVENIYAKTGARGRAAAGAFAASHNLI